MHKFFVDSDTLNQPQIILEGETANHIANVLRLKPFDQVILADGAGHDYCCIIDECDKYSVMLKKVHAMDVAGELTTKLYLYQGLPKKDKMEWIIQKSVELGIYEVIPVSMTRSIVKLDEKGGDKKVARWQAIAESAAAQSKRQIIPKVTSPMSFKNMLNHLKEMDLILVAYENAKGIKYTREVLSFVKEYDKIGLVIGPEGGFSVEEINQLESCEAKIISLGSRILRTETAGLALLSYLMLQIEEDL